MDDTKKPQPEPVILTRQQDGLLTFAIEPPAYVSAEAFRAEFRRNLDVESDEDPALPA